VIFQFTGAERLIFRPRERDEYGRLLTVSKWAAKYRNVVKGPYQGQWTNELTPYAVAPMDAFNLPWVREIYLCWGPQTSKTQTALNCLMYAIDQDPGPCMYVMPDEKVTKRIARRQIIPTLRKTPRTAAVLSSRDSDTSTLSVNLINGMDLMMAWATSPAVMASESVRYLFFDEPGKYPPFSGKEADPFSLGKVRTSAYPHTCKRLYFSTPAEHGDGFSRLIESEPDAVYRYLAECPLCGHDQVMTSDKLRIIDDEKDPRVIRRRKLGRYECKNCGELWDDAMRDKAIMTYRWEPDKEIARPEAVYYHLPSWYSKFVSLSNVCANRVAGLRDVSKLMAYVTQDKAEPFRLKIQTKNETEMLSLKSEFDGGVVPPDAVALTAGIDVQKNGFWFVVRAWKGDLTSWLVQYGFVSEFTDLETLLFSTEYPIFGTTQKMPIWRAAIDTGGGVSATSQTGIDEDWSRTEEVYMWLRSANVAPRRVVFGIKGASRAQQKRINTSIIDKMPGRNMAIPGGLTLRILDTNKFKDILHWRLARKPGQAQRFWLHKHTGMDYIKQFLAEEKRKGRRGPSTWKQIGGRPNHLLDCEVYAAACADWEWMPSLPMLAKQAEAQKTPPVEQPKKKARAEKPADNERSRW
jgi:phage terminase large subunit GpA-like protein